MSNELRSVHDDPPASGKPVSMGVCIDCNMEWFMTRKEKADFEKLILEKNYHWPKRCRDCREKKRSKPKPPNLPDIYKRLRELAASAINEEYIGDGDVLAQELTDVANNVAHVMRNLDRRG